MLYYLCFGIRKRKNSLENASVIHSLFRYHVGILEMILQKENYSCNFNHKYFHTSMKTSLKGVRHWEVLYSFYNRLRAKNEIWGNASETMVFVGQ